MLKRCHNCRFSEVGDFNQTMVAAHVYETDVFTFVDTVDALVAVPKYELTCTNERNWLPSRGDMMVNNDDSCHYWEPRNEEG